MKFPESQFAKNYLFGLKGVEIGGSAHNSFNFNTINVDRFGSMDTSFKKAEIKLCGEAMPVDIVALGDQLPFKGNSYDFVINSHVIEHFFDPVNALKEWLRVTKKYVLMIVPNMDKTIDKGKVPTSFEELIDRHEGLITHNGSAKHHSFWTHHSFMRHMEFLAAKLNFKIIDSLDPDDKVGNGFIVLLEKNNERKVPRTNIKKWLIRLKRTWIHEGQRL